MAHDDGRRGAPRRWLVGSRRSTAGVALVLCAAGLLFSVSAETARGTQLRADRADAADLIRSEQERYAQRLQRNSALVREQEALLEAEARGNSDVRALAEQATVIEPFAGLQAVSGPGLTVVLDDAPPQSRSRPGVKPDDLVVHQQDVQAVVNALWAGGAEAMMLMDQRVISTSAVRCVGNTLILQGRVYSPPYRITAIGDPARMRARLAASPEVRIYEQYVRDLGLVYTVQDLPRTAMPAYDGPLQMQHARVPGGGDGGTPTSSGTPTATGTGTSGSAASSPAPSSPAPSGPAPSGSAGAP